MKLYKVFSAIYVILNFASSEEIWQYNAGPLRYEDARANCESQGLNLATIKTAEDRQNAADAIGTNAAPWTGLYSSKPEGWFIFADGTECEDTESGACVSFWRYVENNANQPRCLHDNTGFYCSAYYGAEGLDNDVSCLTTRPFLCRGMADGCDNLGTYVPGQYDWGYLTNGFSLDRAQALCQHNFGSDLATVLTEADKTAAVAKFTSNGHFASFIGLTDREVEGTWEWIDGTCCVTGTAECTDLWLPGNPDNVIDIFNDPAPDPEGADCVWLHKNGLSYESKCDVGSWGSPWGVLCNKRTITTAKSVFDDNDAGVFGSSSSMLAVKEASYFGFSSVKVFLFSVGSVIALIATIIVVIYNCCLMKNMKPLRETFKM